MYAMFEEVIGPKPLANSKSSHHQTENDSQRVVTTTNKDLSSATDSDNVYGSSKQPKRPHPRIYGSVASYQPIGYSSTLPRSGGRRRLYSSSTNDSVDLDDAASISSSNPLLDTISVLTYDPPDDSDDYYDLNGSDFRCKSSEKSKKPEGDRDSIGYAGSSSIDSGYKSFCPTPEIPDSSVYGTEICKQTNPYYDTSNAATTTTARQARNAKPRIMMGTKVISRQGHVSPIRDSPGSRRSDSSLYDVNLDHLMYLRQSLLSAIQKCESSTNKCTAEPNRTDNPVDDEGYLEDHPTTKPSNYTKTVRFNTDVEVSTSVNQTSPDRTESASENQKVQAKSILKDPLCANLRSQIEAGGTVDCTLEEEIDSLLYGRAEFYDLESVDDFPCSYVTMIEEKYRSGKTSIAKVRKLKGEKPIEETPSKPPSDSNVDPPELSSDESRVQQQQQNPPSQAPTVSMSKTAKCRFTEVARCMLEIIEDLQLKKLQSPGENQDKPQEKDTIQPPSENIKAVKTAEDLPSSNSETYASAAEYHVYEEIDYDFLSVHMLPEIVKEPPPLPARPKCGMAKVPCPPLKKNVSATEVRNRPKQRGNLYCLFSDRVERRNISRSLEREWRDNPDNQEDDYGFKKSI
ncbi:hypothetical protein JTE90_028900 [Oedothorax gibbosus]|uniref:Uncharacterized protein n=1 Tax=Oedothorax gibbosus TaxID=931172 RepID=A0AAV6UQN4_9ARAC|nr:hypothetical protein JTE90_028900 [Oedothorax gibbosus]